MRRTTDARPFEGVERRRTPGVDISVESSNEVTVFHELGKALTSSLQLDQVLRTIMEKINEVLRPDTWSLLLMDQEKDELYFQIATGKGAESLKDVRIKVGQGLAGWVAQTGEAVVVPGHEPKIRVSSARWTRKQKWRRAASSRFPCASAINASASSN